jgi:hypothetical protein
MIATEERFAQKIKLFLFYIRRKFDEGEVKARVFLFSCFVMGKLL